MEIKNAYSLGAVLGTLAAACFCLALGQTAVAATLFGVAVGGVVIPVPVGKKAPEKDPEE